jgi:hypothetical protein
VSSSLQLDVSFLRDFSTVNVVANGVGNAWADTLEIIEGDLVDEIGITSSTFTVLIYDPSYNFLSP